LAENQIEDLKIRLDDVIGAEDLVVQLTEKNLNLNEVSYIQQGSLTLTSRNIALINETFFLP
jgi:hypothetical protein